MQIHKLEETYICSRTVFISFLFFFLSLIYQTIVYKAEIKTKDKPNKQNKHLKVRLSVD